MVQINEGDEPVELPITYFDEATGEKVVVGKAAVQVKNGEVIALGQLNVQGADILKGGQIDVEAMMLSVGPFREPSPAERAAVRMGPLGLKHREYVTQTNPDGATEHCPRRDLHDPHEWKAQRTDIFSVYCPGYVGSGR